MRCLIALTTLFALTPPDPALSQSSPLIDDAIFQSLIDETSGEAGLRHFDSLLNYSGWSPSLGADQTAVYIFNASLNSKLTHVYIDRFPSDGESFFGAFRTEPWWEGGEGLLTFSTQRGDTLADFNQYRGHLARFSTSAHLTTQLLDVGSGMASSDYDDKDVRGKLVLASGSLGQVHQLAVWKYGAAGVVNYRIRDGDQYPHLVSSLQIEPWTGPDGERPGFAFSASYELGIRLRKMIDDGGVELTVHVEAETKPGSYPMVHAKIEGARPELPEIWIQAHTNYRNTGGGNNLTGVGATLDLARTIASLVASGKIERPMRSIRFVWGPEHTALPYFFHQYPDSVASVLAILNLDMVGDHQVASESILRLYRAPYSNPSFLSDIVEEMFETVAAGNTISLLNGRLLNFGSRFKRPIVDPEGSDDPFYYKIERFWGPSDHEDITESSVGIPAVMLNTWPDPFIGTQEDSRERADATQMKRAEVIAGAAALILANANDDALPDLVQNARARARVRIANENRRAASILDPGTKRLQPYKESENIILRAFERESKALRALSVFAESEKARDYLRASARRLESDQIDAQRELLSYASASLDSTILLTRGSQGSSSGDLVPERTTVVRGPINFFRGQYGRDWMIAQTGNPTFRKSLRLAGRGHYYLYETLNFVDGRRTLSEIRDLVGAEYGYASVEDIEQYFRLLEDVGVIRF